MAYKLDSGKVVSPDKAVVSISEDTRWDGSNHISVATGSQWSHETLYKSSKGTWWIEHTSQYEGARPYATELTEQEAAEWITLNGEIPSNYGLVDVAE